MTDQGVPLSEQILPGWQIFYPRDLPPVPLPIFFCHIPKCGGTLIDTVLVTAAFVHNVHHRVWIKRIETDTVAPKIFSQHRPIGHHPQPDRNWQIITILRDPVRRLVSHWAFAVGRGLFTGPDPAAPESLDSLRAYLATPGADNLQVRLLANVPDDVPVGPADLDRALAALDRCFLVGLQEQMDVFLAAMVSSLLPWPVLTLAAQPNPLPGYYQSRTRWQDFVRHQAEAGCRQHDETLYAAARARAAATLEILHQAPARPRDRVLVVPPDCALFARDGSRLPTLLPLDQVRDLMAAGGYKALRPHLRTT